MMIINFISFFKEYIDQETIICMCILCVFFPDIFWEMIVPLRKDGLYLSDHAYILLQLSKPQTLFTTNVTAYLMIKFSKFVIFIILFFCIT